MKFLSFWFCVSSLLYGGERGWNSLELAEAYFYHSEPQRIWANEMLEMHSFNGSERVFDFGCGDGKITAEISRMLPFGNVIGVDVSGHMIHIAKSHFPKQSHPNLEFKQVESAVFSEMDSLYDLIVSFSVFHFVEEPVEILKDFKLHLSPKGCLLLTIPFPPSSVMKLAADKCFSKYGISPPWHHCAYSSKLSMRSIEGCEQKLKEAGYDIVFMQKIDSPFIFEDIDDFIDWLIGTASANWGVPALGSLSFFTDVAKIMVEIEPSLLDLQGRIIWSQPRVHVIAKLSLSGD